MGVERVNCILISGQGLSLTLNCELHTTVVPHQSIQMGCWLPIPSFICLYHHHYTRDRVYWASALLRYILPHVPSFIPPYSFLPSFMPSHSFLPHTPSFLPSLHSFLSCFTFLCSFNPSFLPSSYLYIYIYSNIYIYIYRCPF